MNATDAPTEPDETTKGFTLLEVVVSLAVLAIIMTPLAAAFINSIRETNDVRSKVGATADAQRISSWWTMDVHNVDPNGVAPGASTCPAPPGSTAPATERALITFNWDGASSATELDSSGNPVVTPKSASWVIEGSGPNSELVRRYCEGDVAKAEYFVADSFWKPGYEAEYLVYGLSGYGSRDFCTATTCTIEVSGNFNYKLAIERRVPGVDPPDVSTPPPPVITGVVPGNKTLTPAWLPSVVPSGIPPVDQYQAVAVNGSGVIQSCEIVDSATLSALLQNADACGLSGLSLTIGSPYYVKVKAHNQNGWGDFSDPFGPVSPVPVLPGPPENVAATRGAARITVTWSPPTDNGGAAVTAWKIRTRDA